MAWNSVGLEVLYQVLGWVAFFAWSFSFYPQVLRNYKRKSVVGLNFDFLVLNLTKHSSYLIYNAALFFSPFIQRQYHDKYGDKEMVPVAANDVAFSLHAVTLTAITVFQVFIYEVAIDEDITTTVTPTPPPSPTTPSPAGPLTRARARQLNYQVSSFLSSCPSYLDHGDTCTLVLLRNDGEDKKGRGFARVGFGLQDRVNL